MFDPPTEFLTFHDPDLKLSRLMADYRDETALMSEMGAMSWPGLARVFARSGYRDEWGMAPTAETVQRLWNAVQAPSARPVSSSPVAPEMPLPDRRKAA